MRGSQFFQLLILPKGDITRPSGVIICCPYTRIMAEGPNYDTALQSWKEQAMSSYNTSFSIPSTNKFSTRKVWYSEVSSNEPAFLIDFAEGVALNPLVVLPSSHEIKEQSEHLLGAMFDWKVFCSPVLKMNDAPSRYIPPISQQVA